MENIHVTAVAIKFLQEAKRKIAATSLSEPPKPLSKAEGEMILGYVGYAQEFIEKMRAKGIKQA